MTDRVSGFVVTLKEDVREDDPFVERVRNALRMVAGVSAVRRKVGGLDLHMAQDRRDREWSDAFTRAIVFLQRHGPEALVAAIDRAEADRAARR